MSAATMAAPATNAREALAEIHTDLVDLASAMRGVACLAHKVRTAKDASPEELDAHAGVVGGLKVLGKALQDAVDRLEMCARGVTR